jgi:hypothetical protein
MFVMPFHHCKTPMVQILMPMQMRISTNYAEAEKPRKSKQSDMK